MRSIASTWSTVGILSAMSALTAAPALGRPRASSPAEIDAAIAAVKADPDHVVLVVDRPWRAYRVSISDDEVAVYTAVRGRRDSERIFDGAFDDGSRAALTRSLRGKRVHVCHRTVAEAPRPETMTVDGLTVALVPGAHERGEAGHLEVRGADGRVRARATIPRADHDTDPALTMVTSCPELPALLLVTTRGVEYWFDGDTERDDSYYRTLPLELR